METAKKLTNVQIESLKLFQYNLSDKQLSEIRNMLAKCFAQATTDEMDKLWDEKGWTNDTMNEWANKHLRKNSACQPY